MKQTHQIRLPIFWKFTILLVITVFIYGAINVYVLWNSINESFGKELESKGLLMARMISEEALPFIAYGDDIGLNNELNNLYSLDSNIAYIFFLDKNDKIIAHTSNLKIPASLIYANQINNGGYHVRLIKTEHFKYKLIRDIAYPVYNGLIGTIRIGLVEDNIVSTLKSATRRLLLMIFIFLSIGIFGAFLFSYYLTKPIKLISNEAQKASLDNISTFYKTKKPFRKRSFLRICFTDEIDVLQKKFYEMLRRLHRNQVEKEDMQKSLIHTEKLVSIGILTAGIAHEVNNPLTGIKNCLYRISKNPDNIAQNNEYLELIKHSVEKIQGISKNVLDYSRQQTSQLTEVNIIEVFENTKMITAYQMEKNNIAFQLTYDKEPIYIAGKKTNLEQVFLNLLLNSIDAISERKITKPDLDGFIKVLLTDSSERLIIEIEDNGIGLVKDIVPNIYDPFFTTKDAGKGSGLGLYVSYHIIQDHGGTLRCESNPKESTKFIIQMPKLNGKI